MRKIITRAVPTATRATFTKSVRSGAPSARVVRMTTHLHSSVAVSSLVVLAAALCSGQQRSTPEPVSEIRGIVADESGAVIPQSVVRFEGKLGTTAYLTGMDGSITAERPTGKYAVTITHAGFVTAKLLDFQVNAPTPAEFRVVLRVDHTPIVDSLPSDGGISDRVPTTTSDRPDAIIEPSRAPTAQPATKKSRSMRCLYLWKCSTH